jgi:hypothetical protein
VSLCVYISLSLSISPSDSPQPRSNIYQLFDQLLLLAEGRVVYLGAARDATEYFRSVGCPCPAEYNPADYFSAASSQPSLSPSHNRCAQWSLSQQRTVPPIWSLGWQPASKNHQP